MRQSYSPAFFSFCYLSISNSLCPLIVIFGTRSSWTTLVYSIIHKLLRYLIVFYVIDITEREKERFEHTRIIS